MSGAKDPSSKPIGGTKGGLGGFSSPTILSISSPHSRSKSCPVSLRTACALQIQLQLKSSSLLLRGLSPLFPSFIGILELPLNRVPLPWGSGNN